MPVTELEVSPVGASPPDKGPGKNTIRVLIARNYKRLGLAVRGKTTQTDKGCVDVGIFIRAIAADGAAAMVTSHYLYLSDIDLTEKLLVMLSTISV